MTGNPTACVHCGHPAAGGGIHVGTGADGNHVVACVPECPRLTNGLIADIISRELIAPLIADAQPYHQTPDGSRATTISIRASAASRSAADLIGQALTDAIPGATTVYQGPGADGSPAVLYCYDNHGGMQ